MDKVIKILDTAIYWSIVFLPFSMAISQAPMNVFSGLIIGLFIIKKLIKRERIFMRCALNLPYAVFFIFSVISIINSANHGDSFRGLFKLLRYWALFLIVAEEIKDKSHMKKVVISILLGALLVSVDAIWQVSFGKDFIRGRLPVLNIGLVRATASFPDSNVLGIYLSAIFPLILVLSFPPRKESNSPPFFRIGVLLLLAGIALTYSRPTLLAVYLCMLAVAIIKKKHLLFWLLATLLLISPFVAPASVKQWAKGVDYHPVRFMFNDDRISVYRNTSQMIKAHPFLGVGVNNYMKSYKQYKEFPEYRNIVTSDYMYAHNNLLHMAGEIGLIGLAIFCWFLYRLFKLALEYYKRTKDAYLKDAGLGIILCLSAFLINGLTESSLYYSCIATIFWYLIGLALSLHKFADAN